MYKSVYELNQDQLDELKALMWMDADMDEVWGDEIKDWSEIPNEFVKEYFADINFTDDDFACTANVNFIKN